MGLAPPTMTICRMFFSEGADPLLLNQPPFDNNS